ncbi:MAG: hypothetical protein IJ525_03725 [Alphaproteobacteria bacterium]|nr:hypothetical protein [Alphaproteobacteria bacterium]
MGLFSSHSKSSSSTTTQYTDNSTDINNAAEIGALAHDNTILGAGSSLVYNEQGITGDNLNSLLGTVNTLSSDAMTTARKLNYDALGTAETLYNKSSSLLSQTFDKAVSSVQSSAEKAMDTTAQAYAESDDELRRTIDGIRPIAMYAMIAAIFYFIFRGKKW